MSSEFDLVPSPSTSPLTFRTLRPATVIGRTLASTKALKAILKENNEKWHIFFNDNAGFHNHTAHTVIALWALGANEVILNASYDVTKVYQRPLYDSPYEFTQINWRDGLGDRRFYKAYMTFFKHELRQKGVQRLLEEYVLSPAANYNAPSGSGPTSKHGEMLNRSLDTLMHSFIHIGYGLEFNLPVMLVEGLAQAAVHPASSSILIPPEWFSFKAEVEQKEATSKLHELIDALSVFARVMNDAEMSNYKPSMPDTSGIYGVVLAMHGVKIRAYVDLWDLEGEGADFIEKKVEELIWVVTLIYGVCAWENGDESEGSGRKGGGLNADFFIVHFVTSAHYLPFWVSYLSTHSAKLLFKSYLSVVLAWYIQRGAPKITPKKLKAFFEDPTSLNPTIPGPQPSPLHGALGIIESKLDDETIKKIVNPNPWYAILQSTLLHPDEHVPKLQRALRYFAEMFEDVESLKGRFQDTELEGVEHIDGSIFLRTAVLSANRFGWIREGELLANFAKVSEMDAPGATLARYVWDRKGFYQGK